MEKSVVVTGCGTGIGRTIFDRLLADGWAVIGLEMQESLAAEKARTAAGARGDVVLGDAADSDALDTAAAMAEARAPLRGWVNNAALAIPGNLHEPKRSEVER